MKHKNKKSKAFTLIELLIVISIIGLLASIVGVALTSARSKARDAKRKGDLRGLQTALELYFNDFGSYPVSLVPACPNTYNDYWCRDTYDNSPTSPQVANWIPGLGPYVASMPHNSKPWSTGQPWPYHYWSDTGKRYWLMVGLENTNDKEVCGGGAAYIWMGSGADACAIWGPGLYVRQMQ
ncbi:MAG: hypothetical protein NVSMB66_4800 [Candidatus Doudnabacteria bacterium]